MLFRSRELENIIERTMVLCRNNFIECDHLPHEITQHYAATQSSHDKPLSIKEMERKRIMDTLKRNNWNRLAASRELGIHKTTLFRKIKQLEICLPAKDGRNNNHH